MWGKPPWFIADSFAVAVRNLRVGRDWYKEKLGLQETKTDREEDSGLPFVDLEVSKGELCITLVEAEPGRPISDTRPMLFTKNLEKAHDWFQNRGVAVGPMQSDSGGNRFFRFQDVDGNTIEVCVEP